MHVRARGRAVGARVFAVAGRVEHGAGRGFDGVAELGPEGLARPAELLEERTVGLARALLG
jgi:hypothetical protein